MASNTSFGSERLVDANASLQCPEDYEPAVAVALSIAQCPLMMPTLVYNLCYLKLQQAEMAPRDGMRLIMVHISLATILTTVSMTVVTLFDLVLSVSHHYDYFPSQYTCHWVELPALTSRTARLWLVLFMALLLFKRIHLPSLNICNERTLINVCLTFIWISASILCVGYSLTTQLSEMKNQCYCNYVLSVSKSNLLALWSLRLAAAFLAISILLYVYVKSQTRALDLSINTVQAPLPERIRLWSNISYTKHVLPWAIMHCLWMTLTAAVSMATCFAGNRMSWSLRTGLATGASLMHSMDLFVQPILLIRASYGLRCQLAKCHPLIRALFIGCVIPKKSVNSVCEGMPMGLPAFRNSVLNR